MYVLRGGSKHGKQEQGGKGEGDGRQGQTREKGKGIDCAFWYLTNAQSLLVRPFLCSTLTVCCALRRFACCAPAPSRRRRRLAPNWTLHICIALSTTRSRQRIACSSEAHAVQQRSNAQRLTSYNAQLLTSVRRLASSRPRPAAPGRSDRGHPCHRHDVLPDDLLRSRCQCQLGFRQFRQFRLAGYRKSQGRYLFYL